MTASIQPEVRLIRATDTTSSKQGLQNSEAISAESCRSQALWMGLITIPPGARANAHMHEGHETALYIIQGQGEMWYGENLEQHMTFQAGDFIYIPAGVPHLPANTSQSEPALALGARTDPNEQESVVLLPHLDGIIGDSRG